MNFTEMASQNNNLLPCTGGDGWIDMDWKYQEEDILIIDHEMCLLDMDASTLAPSSQN